MNEDKKRLKNRDFEKREGLGMQVQDKIFEIPKNKGSEFLKQFNAAKITKGFLEECRKSAIKTGRKEKKDKQTLNDK